MVALALFGCGERFIEYEVVEVDACVVDVGAPLVLHQDEEDLWDVTVGDLPAVPCERVDDAFFCDLIVASSLMSFGSPTNLRSDLVIDLTRDLGELSGIVTILHSCTGSGCDDLELEECRNRPLLAER